MVHFANLWSYFKERFPVVNMLLFAILFLTIYSVASYKELNAYSSKSIVFIITGIIATISFFFRLRVFDEMKDFSVDAINHPNRVLQSGRVTIRQLQVTAFVFFIIETCWTIAAGKLCFIFWCVAIVYSILMRYEFFIPSILKRNLLLYAATHMLIMPLIIIWLWWGIVKQGQWSIDLWLLCLLSIAGGFSFEVARKIHSSDAEKRTIDSYSKSIGFYTSIILVNLLLAGGVATQFILLYNIQARNWTYILIAVLFAGTLLYYLGITIKPVEKKLRKAEILVSLFMLISYLSVIIQISVLK